MKTHVVNICIVTRIVNICTCWVAKNAVIIQWNKKSTQNTSLAWNKNMYKYYIIINSHYWTGDNLS